MTISVFAKTENIYELAQSERLQELYEMVIKEQDELIPEISKEKIPWLLGYEPEGQAEMKRVHDLWKNVREHLEKMGHTADLENLRNGFQ